MLTVVSKGDGFVIPLIDVKAHLHVDSNFEDSGIYQYIQAAQDNARRFTGRAIVIETYEFTPTADPTRACYERNFTCQADRLNFRVGSITEIVSINTYDKDGVPTVVSISGYAIKNTDQYSLLIRKDGQDVPRGTRSYDDLVIQFKAGYTEATLPFGLREAILMLIGFYFENRDAMVDAALSDPPTIGIRQMLQKFKLEQI